MPKMPLGTRGAKKLVKLKEHLRKNVIEADHPKVHFDMEFWAYHIGEGESEFGAPVLVERDRDTYGIPEYICNTAACLAGHLVFINSRSKRPFDSLITLDSPSIARKAEQILGIEEREECEKLFIHNNWPIDIFNQYEFANSDQHRAEAAILAIDWFLEEHGYDPNGKPIPKKVGA